MKTTTRNARILTKKVWINGVKHRMIVGFENVKKYDELPNEYTTNGLYFWEQLNANGRPRLQINLPRGRYGINTAPTVGDIMTDGEFEAMTTWLRRAGERLAKINRKNGKKQGKDEWSGMDIVEI
jgi:hypothetical protein